MSYEATYNPNDPNVPYVVTSWVEVDVPTGNPNTLNNPDTSLTGQPFPNGVVPFAYTANVGANQLVPFTSQQTSAWASAQAAIQLTQEQTQGQIDITADSDLGLILRALAYEIVQEFGTVIGYISSIQNAINTATSLANLQTQTKAIVSPVTPTLALLKTAMQSIIANGTVN